jgi:uracil-DNA glycosylase
MTHLPASWQPVVGSELNQPYFRKLKEFLKEQRQDHVVYPPEKDVFTALKLTPYEDVRVVILGQDPYVAPRQAHGLAFSVLPGVSPPPSLHNIFKELHDDLGCRVPNNGYLVPWAEQGVLLLNAVLTVQAGKPNSHKGKGWEKFTDAVIRRVSMREDGIVFVLWGANAQKKQAQIDTNKNTVIRSAHPSPLSARSGFFGSRPFSKINKALREAGKAEVDWQIPNL